MLNFVIGNRAILCSATAIWFGLAFIIMTACRARYRLALARVGGILDLPQTGNLAITGVIANTLFIDSYLVSPQRFEPRAAEPPKIISALKSLNHVDADEDAVMAP